MKSFYLGAMALTLAATSALAQSASVTYTGTVTEYTPRKSIVIRNTNHKLVTYTLNSDLVVPADVEVGKTITLYADPDGDGTMIRKVTTTSLTDAGDVKTTTQSTSTMPDGSTHTSTGTVVKYLPRKSMVVRDGNNNLVTYRLTPEVKLPDDVSVGKSVTVYSDSSNGANSVSRVTTTSLTPEGEQKTTTRTTETSPDGTSTTAEETSVEGTISSYQANKNVTVQRTDGTTVTYEIDSSSAIPADLNIGKRVMLAIFPHGKQRVVRKVTYTTTTN